MTTETLEKNQEQGSDLFPMPDTALGKACKKFVGVSEDIAELKVKRDDVTKIVLEEMAKENRDSLTITVGNDNWKFDIKTKKSIRCVKKTRQPKPKKVKVEEES